MKPAKTALGGRKIEPSQRYQGAPAEKIVRALFKSVKITKQQSSNSTTSSPSMRNQSHQYILERPVACRALAINAGAHIEVSVSSMGRGSDQLTKGRNPHDEQRSHLSHQDC